uniref:Uncharacterized protein n=1 Tax=Avena sativa TaxID=4498 RepID=A0ACD5XMB3_AVESA
MNEGAASGSLNSFIAIVAVVSVLSILGSVAIAYFVYRCVKQNGLPAININTTSAAPVAAASTALYAVVADSQIRDATVEMFLKEIAGEKPIRFTRQQLSGFTNNYSARLGAGGFGAVYKGMLPNGLMVAVKRLHADQDDRTSQEQFMAEVGTIGRTHHINLVRLFGFCYEADVRALVYEYMEHGALDSYLLDRSRRDVVGFTTLQAIAVGVARGLRYLHEECQQKIVAFWCVQQQPEARPPMGLVVKMLEGEMDIAPPANPFLHLMAAPVAANLWTSGTSSANTVSTSANGVSQGEASGFKSCSCSRTLQHTCDQSRGRSRNRKRGEVVVRYVVPGRWWRQGHPVPNPHEDELQRVGNHHVGAALGRRSLGGRRYGRRSGSTGATSARHHPARHPTGDGPGAPRQGCLGRDQEDVSQRGPHSRGVPTEAVQGLREYIVQERGGN